MRLLAASIVILLLAFSLAHAEENIYLVFPQVNEPYYKQSEKIDYVHPDKCVKAAQKGLDLGVSRDNHAWKIFYYDSAVYWFRHIDAPGNVTIKCLKSNDYELATH